MKILECSIIEKHATRYIDILGYEIEMIDDYKLNMELITFLEIILDAKKMRQIKIKMTEESKDKKLYVFESDKLIAYPFQTATADSDRNELERYDMSVLTYNLLVDIKRLLERQVNG